MPKSRSIDVDYESGLFKSKKNFKKSYEKEKNHNK